MSRTRASPLTVLPFVAVIFFLLLVVLATLNVTQLYRVGRDGAQLQLYLDHYARNWLSVCILLCTVVALLVAFVLVAFSLYLLSKVPGVSVCPRLDRRIAPSTRRFFVETTTTSTVTRTRGDNVAQHQQTRRGKLQRQCLLENIHVEKSITFH